MSRSRDLVVNWIASLQHLTGASAVENPVKFQNVQSFQSLLNRLH